MKALLISIKPEWVAKILNGKKTIEIRKRFPKDYIGWVYIYCTKDKKYANLINRGGFLTGMVVARFWCDKVEEIKFETAPFDNNLIHWETKTLSMFDINEKSCLTEKELLNYLKEKSGYAIHIIKLEIFDKPKEISEFKYYKKFSEIDYMLPVPRKETCERLVPLTKAPQSWQFVEI